MAQTIGIQNMFQWMCIFSVATWFIYHINISHIDHHSSVKWMKKSIEVFDKRTDEKLLEGIVTKQRLQRCEEKNKEHINGSKQEQYETQMEVIKLKHYLKSCENTVLVPRPSADPSLPVLYLITPTYARLQQKVDLTRLLHTLMHVPNLHWIVVEDSRKKTDLVSNLLLYSRMRYTHLNVPTQNTTETQKKKFIPKGVEQRNAGLSWIRTHLDPSKDRGVVYFADDDNTYSLELFDEMRLVQKVSVWPVGLVAGLRYESPILENGKVIAWHTAFLPDRTMALDMAGFAVNLDIVFNHSRALFSYNSYPLESAILNALGVTLSDLEPRADGCTKVLVWHTRTQTPSLINEKKMKAKYGGPSDVNIEV